MRKSLFVGLAALALLFSAQNAFAIGEQYGRITGIVYDNNGAVLPGVKLTLSSSALLGGDRNLSSSEDGAFAFNNLPPGKYRLLVENTGLKSIDKRDIVVSIGKTVSLYLVMELPGKEETVVVVAERPVVDTTDMTQGGSVTAELAEDIPTGRSYQDIASFLPGVIDVNGGNPDIHGGTFRNNRYLVDGLDITDPVTLTFSANFNFDAIQEVEVLTGGLDAEYNALGGIINLVTKSGGNDFELDASYYINNKTLSPSQQFGSGALEGQFKVQEVDTTIFATSEANINVGGPIIKDKLWYYVSLGKVDTLVSTPVAAPFFIEHPARSFDGILGRVKLTYQPAQNHTVTWAFSTDPAQITNIGQASNRYVDPSCTGTAADLENPACTGASTEGDLSLGNSEVHRVQGGFFTSARWDWVVGSNLLFKAQAGLSRNILIGFPENVAYGQAVEEGTQIDSFGAEVDGINFAPQQRRSFGVLATPRTVSDVTSFEDIRDHYQIDASVTYLKDNLGGSHEFKAGIQIAPTFFDETTGRAGFASFEDVGGELVPAADGNGFRLKSECNSAYSIVDRATVFPENRLDASCVQLTTVGDNPSENPFRALSTSLDAGIFIQDEWKPTPFLTVKPGIRFDTFRSNNIVDDNVDDNGDGALGPEKTPILSYSGLGPRLGVAWDPTHDGKTLISAYVGQVTESGNLVIPAFAGKSTQFDVVPFDPGLQIYDFSQALTFGGDAGTILACNPDLQDDPLTAQLFEDCRPPILREFSFILERQVGDATVLGINGTFRKQFHMFEDDEANLIFDEKGTAVIGGVNGNANQSVFRLRTPDEAFVAYQGMDVYLRGKPSERSQLLASYSLSRNVGTKDEDTNTQFTFFMDNPRQNDFAFGPLPSDRTHVLKLSGSYDFDFGLSLGASYFYATGGRFDRLFFNPVLDDFVDRRAPRGFDPGGDLNDPSDDVELQLPDISQLNLRVKYSLAPLTGQKMEFIADVFNVFNLGTVNGVSQTDDGSFGLVTSRQSPFQVQLGVRYIY